MSTVRAFPARVVRADRAVQAVSALAELPEDGTVAASSPDPSAYDEEPAGLYVYRQQRADGPPYVGVVCEVITRAFVAGRVRGHEAVQPRRVESLVAHHATHPAAPPALVALLHEAGPAYVAAVAAALASEPLVDFDGPAGLRQTVWRVADPAPLAAELAAADLYVADGHHRVAAALAEWTAAGEPADTGLVCVVHPLDGLRLSAFHRRLPGPLPDLAPLLASSFAVTPADGPVLEPGAFGLYLDGRWSRLEPHDRPPGLDVQLLQSAVLDRLDRPAEIAPAHTPIDELARRCDADGGALVTLAPPPLATITRLADAEQVMPPKTTYFEPKPCTGIFLRP